MLIAVAGNIGSGKTSLVKALAKELGFFPVIEEAEGNPYLERAYKGESNLVFLSQVFFLIKRSCLILEGISKKHSILIDRYVHEDAQVFAKYYYLNNSISESEWSKYKRMFADLESVLPKPDLLIYLRLSPAELFTRTLKRNAIGDQYVSLKLLEALDILYNDWINSYDLSPNLQYSDRSKYSQILKDVANFISCSRR